MLRVSLEIYSQIWGMLTEKSTYYHILPMHDHILEVQDSIVEEFSMKEKGFKIKKAIFSFIFENLRKTILRHFILLYRLFYKSFDQRVRKRELTQIFSI